MKQNQSAHEIHHVTGIGKLPVDVAVVDHPRLNQPAVIGLRHFKFHAPPQGIEPCTMSLEDSGLSMSKASTGRADTLQPVLQTSSVVAPGIKSEKPEQQHNNQQDTSDTPNQVVIHVHHPLVLYHRVLPVCNLPRRFSHTRYVT